MSPAELSVTITGAVLIIFVLWYFLVPPRASAQPSGQVAGGVRDVNITVKGGYEPATISARAGEKLRLNFYRDETDSCSERVVFENGLEVSAPLPAFQSTAVEVGPLREGEYPFHCAMNMLKGRIVVSPA